MTSKLPSWAAVSPVARLATSDGIQPHLVPVVFCVGDDAVYVPIDGKPKSGRKLRRVANIEAHPAVSLLIDHYEDDWTKLRWARIDGDASITATPASVVDALKAKYPQYGRVDVGTSAIRIAIRRVSAWVAETATGQTP